MRIWWLLSAILWLFPAWAEAQTPLAPIAYQDHKVYYPGSTYTTFGRTLAPAEPRNITVLSHIEQGIAYRGAELYVMGEGWNDRFNYDWNNRLIYGTGLRFTQTLRGGMIRGGIAYLADHRQIRSRTYTSGVTLLVESWFGWGQGRTTIHYVALPLGGH